MTKPASILPKCLLVVTALVLVLGSMLSAATKDWTPAVALVRKSLVRVNHPVSGTYYYGEHHTILVEMQLATCTGSVIHSTKEYVLTANHCYGPEMTVDGKMAWPVLRNPEYDLMVLRVEALGKPAVRPSRAPLVPGLPIAALGYGQAFNEPLFRAGYVSAVGVDLSPQWPGRWLTFSGPYVGGMSGGPVFDSNGRIVGIVQLSDERIGFGKSLTDVLKITRQYWENL